MTKFRKITWHLLGFLAICLPIIFLIFQQKWMVSRLTTSLAVAWEKLRGIFLFYGDQEFATPLLINSMNSIEDYPVIFRWVDWESLWEGVKTYFAILFNGSNAIEWLLDFSDFMMGLTRFLMVLVLFVIMAVVIVNCYFMESDKGWMERSSQLIAWKRFETGPLSSFIRYWADYFRWLCRTWYFKICVALCLTILGLPMIVLDLLGEYFYFFTTFDLLSLGDTILAVIATFLVGYFTIPAPIRWGLCFILGRFLTLLHARKLIEGKLMPADEAMVDNDTGVFTLILGKMRGGKTTLAASMARILNTIYHKNAYDNMNRCSMMFPDFPWAALEKDIVRLGSRRRMVNMDQAAAFVYRLYEIGASKPIVLYGYDVASMRTEFIDGANLITLRDAMAIYAESYWVYFQKGNLIASNFPIRTDDLRLDKGHLVLYDTKLFRRKVKDQPKDSSLSRVLIFDMLRLGRKKDPNNQYRDCNGPMVAVATEFGKEQGNMVSNTAYSAKDDEANPKNDLLDYSLKLGGHLANIWHTNFFKFIADEQRSGSLTTNLVTVAQSIFTADRANQKEKMALRGFWVESAILDLVISIRDKFYQKYRYEREDGTLLSYFIQRLGSFAYGIESRIYMRYGYKEVDLPTCTADSSGNLQEGEKKKFYIINKIDYAARFESACMKDFLNARKAKADYGFFDIPTYKKLMPDKNEWDLQGSYLVTDLENPEKKFTSNPRVTGRRCGSRRQTGANRPSARNGGDGR